MGLTNAQLLITANFLHSLPAGLVAPVLTPHITAKGGNHVILGLLVASQFVCNNISTEIAALFEHGKKHVVDLSLYMSLVSYLWLVFCSSWWEICANRCLYGLTNHVDEYSKKYITKMEPKDRQVKICNLVDVAKVAGVVMGSIAGGYLFELTGSFSITAMISTIFVFLSILLLQYVDGDSVDLPRPSSSLTSLPTICRHQLRTLNTTEFTKHWEILLLVSTYTFSFVSYSSRFAFLLSSNYEIGIIIAGYSIGYQTMLQFVCERFLPLLKTRIGNSNSFFEYCLVVCGVTLSGLYYAFSFETYLIVFVPMIFTSTLINLFLEEDILNLKTKKVGKNITVIQNLISIVAPVVFGVMCELFGGKAFKVLSILPMVVCIYLLRKKLGKEARLKEE